MRSDSSPPRVEGRAVRIASRIALLYAVVGAAWILFSDELMMQIIPDQGMLGQVSVFKGLAFIVVTSLLLYGVLRHRLGSWEFEVIARRRAEDGLRQWADVFEHCTHGIVVGIPATNRVLVCNPALARILGRTVDEIAGMPILDLHHPGDREHVLRHLADCDRQGTARYEARMMRHDGTAVPVQMDVVSVPDREGAPLYRIATVQDIREHKRAEEEVRKLWRAVEQSPVSIVITNPAGEIEYANPSFTQVTGYTLDEVRGRNPSMLQSGETPDDAYRKMWATITTGGVWHGEFLNRKKNGDLFRETASISPVFDDAGRITHFIALKEDVTERHRLEEQLRLSQKMEAVGRLAGGVAHDFNNLLGVIIGHSHLLMMRITDPELRAEIDEIEKAGQRAGALTRQLLAFSRKQVLAPRVLDLNTVVTDLEKMLLRMVGEDVRLTTRLSADLGATRADPGQIEQVIMNLVVNARDAMPSGGTITIETSNVDLDQSPTHDQVCVVPGRYVLVSIADDGVGMDETTRKRAFEPFFTTKKDGTGLGLATAYGIVKQSGGYLWVESEPGFGTTFRIYLPRVDEKVDARPGPSIGTHALQGNETILLVEDADPLRVLVRRFLVAFGYRVLEASSGDDALKVAATCGTPIDLLLTDVVMPGMSGAVLADRLKANLPGLRVLFMSGYTDTAIAHHGVLDPGRTLISKPFTREELGRKVRELLDTGAGELAER